MKTSSWRSILSVPGKRFWKGKAPLLLTVSLLEVLQKSNSRGETPRPWAFWQTWDLTDLYLAEGRTRVAVSGSRPLTALARVGGATCFRIPPGAVLSLGPTPAVPSLAVLPNRRPYCTATVKQICSKYHGTHFTASTWSPGPGARGWGVPSEWQCALQTHMNVRSVSPLPGTDGGCQRPPPVWDSVF